MRSTERPWALWHSNSLALSFLAAVQVLQKVYESGEPLVHIVFGGERMLVVNDSALAKQVLTTSTIGGAWKKRGTAIFPGPELVGEGLLVAGDQAVCSCRVHCFYFWLGESRLSHCRLRQGGCVVMRQGRLCSIPAVATAASTR